jgi:hypothetical protein
MFFFATMLFFNQQPYPSNNHTNCTSKWMPCRRSLSALAALYPQEIEMEVEGLDGATASLGFFLVVGILIFGCLQDGGWMLHL